jgi:hypothetical protein
LVSILRAIRGWPCALKESPPDQHGERAANLAYLWRDRAPSTSLFKRRVVIVRELANEVRNFATEVRGLPRNPAGAIEAIVHFGEWNSGASTGQGLLSEGFGHRGLNLKHGGRILSIVFGVGRRTLLASFFARFAGSVRERSSHCRFH